MKFANFFVIYIPNELKDKFNIPSTRVDYEHAENRKKDLGFTAFKLHISFDQTYSS